MMSSANPFVTAFVDEFVSTLMKQHEQLQFWFGAGIDLDGMSHGIVRATVTVSKLYHE